MCLGGWSPRYSRPVLCNMEHYNDVSMDASLQIAPTAMLFIPCRKGVSHRPDEYASPADMQRGVQVLGFLSCLIARNERDHPQQ